MVFNDIYIEGGERNICCNCVEEIGGGVVKSYELKKVGYITVFKTVEFKEDKK